MAAIGIGVVVGGESTCLVETALEAWRQSAGLERRLGDIGDADAPVGAGDCSLRRYIQRVGEDPAEAQAPLADALVADDDPTRRQDQLNVSQAQAEAVIEPDRMLDDRGLARKPRYWFGGIVMFTACHGPAEAANLTAPSSRTWQDGDRSAGVTVRLLFGRVRRATA